MYYFTIEYLTPEEDKFTTDSGLVAAANWSDATKKIVDYVGNEYLISIKLEELDNPLYEEDILDCFNHEVEKANE